MTWPAHFTEAIAACFEQLAKALRVLMVGQDVNGAFVNVLVNPDGSLVVSPGTAANQAAIGPAGSKAFSDFSGSGYVTVLSDPGADYVQLTVFNTLDQPMTLSIDGGSTDHYRLPVRGSFTFDYGSNGRKIAHNNVSVKRTGSAPTAGEISVTAVR